MAVTPMNVLDDTGFSAAFAEAFQLIENNYIRRTTYETDIADLVSRIDALNIYDQYPCDISTGDLIFTMPDDANVNLAVNASGELELTTASDTLTTAEKALSKYNFDINENGYLVLTIE